MTPRHHLLKIWPQYFNDIRRGKKTAEIRFDDRDFRIGDTLILQEWKPLKKAYTGRAIRKRVVGMTRLCQVIPKTPVEWVVIYLGDE